MADQPGFKNPDMTYVDKGLKFKLISPDAEWPWEAAKAEITEGPLKGYICHPGMDPYEDLAGPFGYKTRDDGTSLTAFYAEEKHLNGGGFLHGGLLMTFADTALFNIGGEHLNGPSVTLNLSGDFTAAAPKGRMIFADGQVMKATRGLVFVQGRIFDEDDGQERVLLSFSGIVKKLKMPKVVS